MAPHPVAGLLSWLRQAVQRHAVPLPLTDAPGDRGLVSGQADLGVRKTLAGVDIGAAGLEVVPGDLRRKQGRRQKQQTGTRSEQLQTRSCRHAGSEREQR